MAQKTDQPGEMRIVGENPARLEGEADRIALHAEGGTGIRTAYVDHAGFRFVLLTLAPPDGRPATLGPMSLARFEAAVQALDLSAIDAVAVTGTGSVFCAGADLKAMVKATTRAQAEDVARQGLKALGQLAELAVPTFAFVNGTALGGGLELALHADYRTAADSTRALGFPEVRLGLIPGWAGIPRTVALAGAGQATSLLVMDSLAGKHLSASTAAEVGLVDVVLPQTDFLTASLDFASGILSGQTPKPHRPDRIPDHASTATDGGPTPLESVRGKIDARLHGAAPAPYRALELIAAAAHTPGGLARNAEVEVFGDLLLSGQARASIYAFHLTQSLAKNPAGRPAVEPRPVHSAGVVGAGLMASQLALVFAQRLRVPVRITDLSQERIDSALTWISGQLDRQVNRGHLNDAEAKVVRALISGDTDKAAFADCDVVIEAVYEDLAVKRAVFAELEPLLRPDALLLTNTSSLSIEAMGASLARPERLIGFHFFNPVAVLPLVEIISSPKTDETTLSTAFELARQLRKTPVLTKDTAGFVVNRLLTRLLNEVLSLLDAGADPIEADHALDSLGLPMTPLELLQFIGPAVQLHICETMHRAYPQRFGMSQSLRAIVAAGLPGYLGDMGKISPAATALLPASQPVDPEAVRSRVILALAEEVTEMLNESVVAGPEQIDLCMLLGANYPLHAGGLTPLLDREAGTQFHPRLRVPLATA